MPTLEYHANRALENLAAAAATAAALGASWWAHLASGWDASAPRILQALGALVALSTIYRNYLAIKKGKP